MTKRRPERKGLTGTFLLLVSMCLGGGGIPDDFFLVALATFLTNLVLSFLALLFPIT